MISIIKGYILINITCTIVQISNHSKLLNSVPYLCTENIVDKYKKFFVLFFFANN
jgi:hypothetical protein